MSLTSPRLIAPFIAIALAALIASCSQQFSPTAPSSLTGSPSMQTVVAEFIDVLVDDTPGPAASEHFRPNDEPAPPPPSGSAPSPWPPGPPPSALPGVPVPTPPSTHVRVALKVDPEPVPHSGTPVGTFSCRDHKYTWYYDQYIHGETGIPVRIVERENFFDGRFSSKNTQSFELTGNGTVKLQTRWCSSWARPHYTQTRYKAVDDTGQEFTISGPWVRLLTP